MLPDPTAEASAILAKTHCYWQNHLFETPF